MLGACSSPPLPPSGGSRIRIVYTESWLTDLTPSRLLLLLLLLLVLLLLFGNERDSRGPEFSCNCPKEGM